MQSIRKNDDFRKCYREGRSRADKYLVLYHAENGTKESRIGISVSKKVGNSVVRHRIRRLVKENYRLHEEKFSSGLDYVVVARRSANGASYHQIETSLLTLMKRSGCWVEEKAAASDLNSRHEAAGAFLAKKEQDDHGSQTNEDCQKADFPAQETGEES